MNALRSTDLPTLLSLYDSDDIREMAVQQRGPEQLLTTLLQKKNYEAATAFLAFSLTSVPAIGWGYFCLVHAHVQWSREETTVIQQVQSWLAEHTEDNRRLLETCLDLTGVRSPAGWLGQALFWSGGSITPEGKPEVYPGPSLQGHALSGAVQLVALADSGTKSHILYPLFIRTGLRILKGMSVKTLISRPPEVEP